MKKDVTDPGRGERTGVSSTVAAELLDGALSEVKAARGLDATDALPVEVPPKGVGEVE